MITGSTISAEMRSTQVIGIAKVIIVATKMINIIFILWTLIQVALALSSSYVIWSSDFRIITKTIKTIQERREINNASKLDIKATLPNRYADILSITLLCILIMSEAIARFKDKIKAKTISQLSCFVSLNFSITIDEKILYKSVITIGGNRRLLNHKITPVNDT